MLPRLTSDELSGRVEAHFQAKNVLITGGFGFIGSHLAKTLLAFGAKVTVLDNRIDPSIDSLLNDQSLGLRAKIAVVQGDLADRHVVRETLAKGNFHFVFNFAAYATVIEKALENPYDTFRANTFGLVNVLEAARLQRPLRPLVFHASTDKVYGEMEGVAYDEEKTPLRGIGVYDAAKLAADLFARTYHEVYGLPTVVLRMCNIFGPYDFNTDYRLIPRALRNLYAEPRPRSPELYLEAVEHWREYLYIDDCIRAILLVAFHRHCQGGVFNLAATAAMSTPDVLKTVIRLACAIEQSFDEARAKAILACGIAIRVRSDSLSLLAIKRQRLDGSKLRRFTEFEPAIGFAEGLERTVRAYRAYYLSGSRASATLPVSTHA